MSATGKFGDALGASPKLRSYGEVAQLRERDRLDIRRGFDMVGSDEFSASIQIFEAVISHAARNDCHSTVIK